MTAPLCKVQTGMASMASLFEPLTFRSVTLRNCIVISAVCEHLAQDGFADDGHSASAHNAAELGALAHWLPQYRRTAF